VSGAREKKRPPADPLAALLAAQGLGSRAFPPSSRYHGLPTAERVEADGRTAVYVRRRFLPPPERFATVGEHRVVDGDRLDNLAARHVGDPEQFWRLADANRAMHPDELTAETGRRLRLTLPEGIPAPAGDD